VQYERALAASSNSEASLPYSNSAYYDSQLSLASSSSPKDLSPSSNSISEVESRLATPEARTDQHLPSSFQTCLTTPPPARLGLSPVEEQLSPMTAAMHLSTDARNKGLDFGSLQRRQEHRKTFSADLSPSISDSFNNRALSIA